MFKYLGEATQTSASVIVRGTSNGEARLICNGVTYIKTINSAVKDGLVRFDVSGLEPGKSYEFSVTTQDESATGTLKTQSDGVSRLGWFSCSSGSYDCLYTTGLYDLHALVCIGDEEYYEGTVNVNLTTATDVSLYNGRARGTRESPTKRYAINKAPFYIMHDDHEYGINDCRWSLVNFQNAIGPTVTNTADMQAVIDAGAESTEIYNIGNPNNTDSGIDTGAFYFRFDLGEHAEVFVLAQCVWGRDPTDATRLVRPDFGASNTMMGSKQVAWLKDRLKNSTKTFKIILSPKMTLTAEFTNSDGFFSYFDEFNLNLAPFIHAATDWLVPGGVIWGTGDYHTPSVHAAFDGVNGAVYDHVEVCACPSQKDNDGVRDSGIGGTYTVQSVNTGQGNAGTSSNILATNTRPEMRNFGVMEVPADGAYIEAKIVLADGREWWTGRVMKGENKLTYSKKNTVVS